MHDRRIEIHIYEDRIVKLESRRSQRPESGHPWVYVNADGDSVAQDAAEQVIYRFDKGTDVVMSYFRPLVAVERADSVHDEGDDDEMLRDYYGA